MDFEGAGTVSTEHFRLKVVCHHQHTVAERDFNWRGKNSACTITFAVQNSRGEQSWVDVSDAGDVTVDSNVDVLPTATTQRLVAGPVFNRPPSFPAAVFTTIRWIAAALRGLGPPVRVAARVH
jgi:hypothetical protein